MYKYFELNGGGHNIRCKLYCRDEKLIGRIVLFCHGFGGHKDNGAAEKFAMRAISKHKDIAVLTFNWPCHGDDVKKKLRLEDCMTYLGLLLPYLREKYKTGEISCYATSFGGYLCLKYIQEHGNPFKKIALRCPAVNLHEVISTAIKTPDELSSLKKRREIPVGFDRKIMIGLPFLEELRENDIQQRDYSAYADDILIIHGSADEIVPFEAAAAFAEKNGIDFVPVDGADHRFKNGQNMEQAIKLIMEYFGL